MATPFAQLGLNRPLQLWYLSKDNTIQNATGWAKVEIILLLAFKLRFCGTPKTHPAFHYV